MAYRIDVYGNPATVLAALNTVANGSGTQVEGRQISYVRTAANNMLADLQSSNVVAAANAAANTEFHMMIQGYADNRVERVSITVEAVQLDPANNVQPYD